ncbi:type I-E CRISPR-associated protein Cas6/Cse3/CasE [Microbacterium sp. ARD32]|uniref:type I-E CRISPR-associated protein Cas6/Cse3/CasE n=1 Tax=Microbacterium sp. ARD32 TaxID=2962577 RepID=UPI002881861C|nr:type I-E CRISPR-associated protein Cas6/Cse3/CasE [Microbacterium sp. ARD32]MDT0157647.1 type I-E CRISPR-associated protein Cas6/Cse3/CasE [Microbacterium sp. ARD32]
MFLSRIQLNPARRDARPLLSSPHTLHAAVLTAFPDPSPRASGRVLWRLDSHEHRTMLYVVSPEAPDLTHLAEQAGWPTRGDTWQVRPYDQLLARIENGQRYGFRLTANPVRSARLPSGERGKVYGHVTVSQQEQWLLDREERAGFHIENFDPEDEAVSAERALRVVDRRTLTFSRRETSVTLRVATYEGVLEVRDRDAFVHALSFGIGRAKGYGCGLMTIAPVR